MHYTLTIQEEQFDSLRDAIFSWPDYEGAAYLFCGSSVIADEHRLLVREVVPVAEEHYLRREPDFLSITSVSYAAAAKRARLQNETILFVHSHPNGFPEFSPQDDCEEPKLMEFLTAQAPNKAHGSLVISSHRGQSGRIWHPSGWLPLQRIRVQGRRFQFFDCTLHEDSVPEFFDRQVRAFGPDIQRLLGSLHIGVVGAGGTGSAVIEQLARLGVGTLSIFDGDHFEPSNVNRVYGATVADAGRFKAAIAGQHVRSIGVGTDVRVYCSHITDEATAMHLRQCDIVFGCTDKHTPRGILVQLALRYLIPVIDTGVVIDSEDGFIRGIFGRAKTLLPGEECLFCRKQIDPDIMRLESLSPQEQEALADEDYAPRLNTNAPAVITFTTAVASQAVSELLHRLTGFMGGERQTSEVLLRFHETKRLANPHRTPPNPDCVCGQTKLWGRGDSRNFLGMMWPEVTTAG